MNKENIYLAGPDGSGKTTFLKKIEAFYEKNNFETQHIWLRSPKIFSKPLMLYCRLTGLTKYNVIDGVKYGKHEFYRSSFVSWLFPPLQLLDFKLKWLLIKARLNKNQIILFDRFSLDTLADLMVDTDRMGLHKSRIGKAFIRTIPSNTKIIILKVNEANIRSRKKDTLHDEHLHKKIAAFNILGKDLNLNMIDNNRAPEEVTKIMFNYLGINAGS